MGIYIVNEPVYLDFTIGAQACSIRGARDFPRLLFLFENSIKQHFKLDFKCNSI